MNADDLITNEHEIMELEEELKKQMELKKKEQIDRMNAEM